MKITLEKDNIVLLCSLSYCFYFISNSIFFVFIPIIICLDFIVKGAHYLSIFLFISIFFLFVDFYNSKDIIILGLSTILMTYKFNNLNPINVLYKNSIGILFLLIFLLFNEPKGTNWLEVLSFQTRLSFDLFTGKFINPNPLGLLSSICLIGLFLKKRYIVSIIPFIFLLTTQSRAALLFFLIFLIFYYVKNIRNIIILTSGLLAFLYFLKDSLFLDRYKEIDDSGRSEHISFYMDIFKNNYLTGYSIRKLDEMYFNTGLAIDNMYYSLIIRYGIIMGFLLISIYFYMFFRNFNSKDPYIRLRLAIFSSILAYGLFEKGFLFTYLLWIPLSICFNNLLKGKI